MFFVSYNLLIYKYVYLKQQDAYLQPAHSVTKIQLDHQKTLLVDGRTETLSRIQCTPSTYSEFIQESVF